jgi:ribosomal protein S12 methylthiotransferase
LLFNFKTLNKVIKSEKSLNLVTLGCSKNLVDSEFLLKQLEVNGFDIRYDSNDYSNVVIINTCGFILDAKNESIEQILRFAKARQKGYIDKLYVIGCLSERYKDELRREIGEVDAFFGVNSMKDILDELNILYNVQNAHNRFITTPKHYAYLKISEGCDRKCSFCAIPIIRGKHISKPIHDLVEEASLLAAKGVKELILIAQDLTFYGTDIHNKQLLYDLLKDLQFIDGIEWIRLQYAYPTAFPKEVIKLMANNEKFCHYLDLPVQHINDNILNKMQRGHSRQDIINLLSYCRTVIPDIALRTTLLVGFPGETNKEFAELYDFVKGFQFDRLGVFTYSEETDTFAASHYKDNVTHKVKKERLEAIMELQQQISLDKNKAKRNQVHKVLIDRVENGLLIGRTQYDSPDVDNEVIVKNHFTHDQAQKMPGQFVNVLIESFSEFDLYGRML